MVTVQFFINFFLVLSPFFFSFPKGKHHPVFCGYHCHVWWGSLSAPGLSPVDHDFSSVHCFAFQVYIICNQSPVRHRHFRSSCQNLSLGLSTILFFATDTASLSSSLWKTQTVPSHRCSYIALTMHSLIPSIFHSWLKTDRWCYGPKHV